MTFFYPNLSLLDSTLIITSAFLLDLLFGDPEYRLHPVRLIGRLIGSSYMWASKLPINRRLSGVLIVFFVLFVSICSYLFFWILFSYFNLALLLDVFLAYSFIAIKDLVDHVNPIIESLKKGELSQARYYLSKVVGRDTRRLDKEGIIRAAVETIAEGFVDGFFSPLFWFFAGIPVGCPVGFMLGYKVINTLDSMLGYKSEQLKEIGWASARLDDLVNFVPARVSILFLLIGAFICRLSLKRALYVTLRDRLKHSSPNSGHSEAFFAGAIGIKLGGPTYYFYGLVQKPWIGDEVKKVDTSDILTALRLAKTTSFFCMFCCFLMPLLFETLKHSAYFM
jgi:adenosylcobinamide-phosphate synthase